MTYIPHRDPNLTYLYGQICLYCGIGHYAEYVNTEQSHNVRCTVCESQHPAAMPMLMLIDSSKSEIYGIIDGVVNDVSISLLFFRRYAINAINAILSNIIKILD